MLGTNHKEINDSMRAAQLEERIERERAERRKVLLVGQGDHFTEEATDYAVHLAERLDYEIFAVNIGRDWDARSSLDAESSRREAFRRRAGEDARALRRKATAKGVHCEHMVKFGDLDRIARELSHEVKRAEIMVADATVDRKEIAGNFAVPIFSVSTNSFNPDGGKSMANEKGVQKQKPWGQTIGYGALTAALYAAVFTHADPIMHTVARGGWYAALPIATVFLFSFAHGAFASNLWCLLGIEAARKGALRQVQRKVVQKRKPVQKRPRVYAYVNPFHRI
jgi:hypothetical protein